MSVIFGHPTGNPNAFHAALSHFQAGWLEIFCVPWIPTGTEMALARAIPGVREWAERLNRRRFPGAEDLPRVEGRIQEWYRMVQRLLPGGASAESLAYQANDWLMRTMKRECGGQFVTTVHAYEDCSLLQFQEAKVLGKFCIYDMPIGYYPAWKALEKELAVKYEDWLPTGGLRSDRHVRPEQKRQEMELADLVLVPSTFVTRTIGQFLEKRIALAPYGVDSQFWQPVEINHGGPLRFIYAGQCSLRKGTPLLLEAWRQADLKDATLELAGSWQLSKAQLRRLPKDVIFSGPLSAISLKLKYQASDVFVFPSFFEGFGLVLLEAMACGLPVIASDATAAPDFLDDSAGHIVASGDLDALVESLRWFSANRDLLKAMGSAVRRIAERHTWERYRNAVTSAVTAFV